MKRRGHFGGSCYWGSTIDRIIIKQVSRRLPVLSLQYLYENSAEDSSVRRLIIHFHNRTSGWIYSFEDSGRHHYPKGFLFEMAFALYELSNSTEQRIQDLDLVRSDYYVKRT